MQEIITFRAGRRFVEPVDVGDEFVSFPSLAVREFDSDNSLVIDSYFDLIDIVPKSLVATDGSVRITGRYSRPETEEGIAAIHARYERALERDAAKRLAVFTVCPTYSCNMSCVYCFEKPYQTSRATATDEDLDRILDHIEAEIVTIRLRDAAAPVRIELFGGEPMQARNEEVVSRVLQFARDHDCSVSIVSNGYELRHFVAVLLRFRDIVAEISVTLDGPAEVHNTMRRVSNEEGSFATITGNIDLMLDLGFYMNVCTNVDASLVEFLPALFEFYEEQGWTRKANFRSTIGRVYDRLNPVGCSTVTEVDVLTSLLSAFPTERPEWLRSGFLKTSDRLAKLVDLDFSQNEWGRALYHYCWSSSPIFDGYYVDPAMNTYRCTTTVGNEAFSIGQLDTVDAESYKATWLKCSVFSDDECRVCEIGGLCAGGCALENSARGKSYVCEREKAVFEQFVGEVLLPHLVSSLRAS